MTISSIEILNEQPIDSRDQLSFAECPTSAKVMRAAAAVIGIALPFAGLASGNLAVFALSLVGSAIAFVSMASINDYDDPLELQKMRIEAKDFNWNQLTNKHSLSRLSQLLSQREIMQKFQAYYENRRFSDILSDYSLSTINKYGLADFSEFSFLRTCFVKEIKQYPLTTLRTWYQNSWGLGNFPYRMILPARQMDGLLAAKADLILADDQHSQALRSLDFQYSYRMDNWLRELTLKELEIPSKVREHGKEIEAAVKKSYADEIRKAKTRIEELEIIRERDEVAREARRDAEALEKERLETEILLEKLDPFRNTLAVNQQDLYDIDVRSANAELSRTETQIMNYVLSIM